MAITAHAHRLVGRATPWLWGVVLTTCFARRYFGYGPGEMHVNHEGYSYVHRVMEFADLLHAGYLWPQWAVDFRLGLGSPYFGYYQPLFFYLASGFAAVLPLPTAMAASVWTVTFAGYAGMLALVRRRFGVRAGMLAGTALLAARYVLTEVYFRGDLSELTGMMLLPAALHWMTAWLDEARPAAWYALAANAAALLCAHPVAGLFGYGALVVVVACWVAMGADRRRAGAALAALGAGVGLAGFYLLPVALEWHLVQGGRLTFNEAPLPFVELGALIGLRPPSARYVAIPVALGVPMLLLASVAAVQGALRWRTLDVAQRRMIASMAVVAAAVVWLMHPASHVVWDALPILRFVQFPARALLVLSVVLASLVGALLARHPASALLAGALLGGPLLLLGTGFQPAPIMFPHPDSARGLATTYIAPDGANEWLPRDAEFLGPGRAPRAPACTGTCLMADFSRTAGRLHVRIVAAGETEVTLPHYYFPVGWHATFDGAPIPLSRAEHGLMRVTLGHPDRPISGELDLVFTTTPARRLGIATSFATVLLLAALAFRERNAKGEQPA
jgi:hypothetical protein